MMFCEMKGHPLYDFMEDFVKTLGPQDRLRFYLLTHDVKHEVEHHGDEPDTILFRRICEVYVADGAIRIQPVNAAAIGQYTKLGWFHNLFFNELRVMNEVAEIAELCHLALPDYPVRVDDFRLWEKK